MEIIPNVGLLNYYLSNAVNKGSYEGLGTTILCLRDSALTRFSRYMIDENTILATFFDPRFKIKAFKASNDEHLITYTNIDFLTKGMLNII